MERLHAGDAEGVLDVLGIQTRTVDQIVIAVTETVQHDLDQVRRTYEFKKTIDYVNEYAKAKSLAQYADRISRLESRIQAIQDRLTHTAEQVCPICFDEVEVPSITPCCRNLFCFRCICEVLRRTTVCPLCRELIPSIQTIQVIGDHSDSLEPVPQMLTKQEQFRKFLQNTPECKTLLFSIYDATFDGIGTMLEADGVTFATLGGSHTRIAKLLRQFAEGKYRVLFLNASNMGAGLNIISATHVVLYHKMSVETKNQIIGRAVRMGRTEPLTVMHLLHGNEMLVREEEGLTTGTGNSIQHV
jgi:SNF2 family DNA or RNA helicase